LRFPVTASPPTPDAQILQQIALVSERDLFNLRSTLKQIENLLYGNNYAVALSVNAATLKMSDLPFNELMLVLYPKSTPHNATILPVCPEELMADVTGCLLYEGDNSSGPQLSDRRLKTLSETLLPEFWRQLGALSPLQSSSIYSYSSDMGLPGYFVFWFFAYLIHYSDTNRCVAITGMSSD
jgi:hypothetical protein